MLLLYTNKIVSITRALKNPASTHLSHYSITKNYLDMYDTFLFLSFIAALSL